MSAPCSQPELLASFLRAEGRQDQLDVPPGQRAVCFSNQSCHARDYRSGGAGASKGVPVVIAVVGGGYSGLTVSPAAGRPAHPQVRASFRVAAAFVVMADGADRRGGIEVGILLQVGGVADSVSVAAREDVENAFTAVSVGDSVLDGRFPQCSSISGMTRTSEAPAVVGNGRGRRMSGHGVRYVGIGEFRKQVVSVYTGPGGCASHPDTVVLRRDEAGHGGAVILSWVVDVGLVWTVVVIERGEDVVRQVLVLVVHSIIHHRHVDARACVGGPHLLDPDILAGAVAESVIVLQVPLAAVERVVYAGAPGNVGAVACKMGLLGIHDRPNGVTPRLRALLARHPQVVGARIQCAIEVEKRGRVTQTDWNRSAVFTGQATFNTGGVDIGGPARSTDGHVSGLCESQAEVVLVAGRVYVPARRNADGQWLSVGFRAPRLGDGRDVHRVRPIRFPDI